MIDLKKLVKSGVHFGHQTSRWCPKMAPYIWGNKGNIHLINVAKTAQQLEKATKFLEQVAAEGKQILWIGTKKPAQKVVEQIATELAMPYVCHRWIGGTLSNNSQVRKSVTKLLHYQDIVDKAEKFPHYTKKEINTYKKIVERLKKNIGGIVNLRWPIGAIVLIDVKKESSALKEAVVTGIPVVALVDTNGNPSGVDYVIPGNDDVPRAISVIAEYLKEGVVEGKKAAVLKEKEEAEAKIAAKKAKADEKKEVKDAGVKSTESVKNVDAKKKATVTAKEETGAAVVAKQSSKPKVDGAEAKAKK